MSVLQHVGTVLQETGYVVQLQPTDPSTLYFEDYSLFGFVTVYESVKALLDTWERNQDSFLQTNAPFLRSASQKAWNCYTVHLAEAAATAQERQALFDVEENFTSTRKIARGSVTTESDVRQALYPLIPVQNAVRIQASPREADVSQRLHDWPEAAVKALLGAGSAEDVVTLLLEPK